MTRTKVYAKPRLCLYGKNYKVYLHTATHEPYTRSPNMSRLMRNCVYN